MRKPTWVLVVPVKRLDAAKSRLRGAVPGVPHELLALALAQDTVVAAVACADVLVITDDPRAARALATLGARVEPDQTDQTDAGLSAQPDAGLNAAARHGAALAAGTGRRVGILTADLPALRPDDLATALAAAPSGPAFVPDAAGTGTTLLLAGADGALTPRFGPDSARAHAAGGARDLVRDPAGCGSAVRLRRDVDTPADLADADRLGLGRHTAALVHRGGTAAGYGASMQGTVATYDAETRSGTLLLDDGTEVRFPATAFDASGLRLLRLGQRLRVDHDDSGQIIRVTLPTF